MPFMVKNMLFSSATGLGMHSNCGKPVRDHLLFTALANHTGLLG